jgi:hypothetical protein
VCQSPPQEDNPTRCCDTTRSIHSAHASLSPLLHLLTSISYFCHKATSSMPFTLPLQSSLCLCMVRCINEGLRSNRWSSMHRLCISVMPLHPGHRMRTRQQLLRLCNPDIRWSAPTFHVLLAWSPPARTARCWGAVQKLISVEQWCLTRKKMIT